MKWAWNIVALTVTSFSAEAVRRGLQNSTAATHGSHAPFAGDPTEAELAEFRGPVHHPARSSFLRVGARADFDEAKVLIVMYSDSRFYSTRMQWVLDTWAKNIPQESFAVVGDKPYPNPNVKVVETGCPAHSHWEGACCKYAEAVIYAHQVMTQDPSYSWVYFTDDDAYVRPSVLAKKLAQVSMESGDGPMALGRLGCNTNVAGPSHCASICAGGGYAASRAAIESLANNGENAIMSEELQYCNQCGHWADASMTQMILRRKISLQPLVGVNAWKLNKTNFDASLTSDVDPIMYHYIQSKAQMDMLHALFNGQSGTNGNSASPLCSTYHGNTQCAVSDSPTSTPWQDKGKFMTLADMASWENYMDSDN